MADTEKKFKEKYLAGEIEFEEIDDYSQEWGFSDEPVTLREYLGLNAEEEDAWVSIGTRRCKKCWTGSVSIRRGQNPLKIGFGLSLILS